MNNEKLPSAFNNQLGIKGWLYAGNYSAERYAYLLHRITGLALILYLCLHVFVNFAKINSNWWSWLMDNMLHPAVTSPFFWFIKLFEYALMLAFIFHAMNGIRLIFTELGIGLGKPAQPKYPYKASIHRQRAFMWIMMLLAGIFIGVSGYEFFFVIK